MLIKRLLDVLREKPLVPLFALDVCVGESEHNDTTKVVYCTEVNLEKSVFVLALPRAGDKEDVRIAFLTVYHIESLDEDDQRR
jgi:hypothetical protein